MKLTRKVAVLKLPELKTTAGIAPVRIAPPPEVLLPVTMHACFPAEPVVQAGDHVYVGQLIAKACPGFSSPVHATVSGTVKAIEPYGSTAAIRIQSDSKMEPDPALKIPQAETTEEFLAAVRDSGIVGLGGAGFPLWGKLDAVRKKQIHTVLINGAECEPYITSDHRTMLDHSDYIVKGIALLKKYLKSKEFILCIEDNKPDAIAKMKEVFAGDSAVTVKQLNTAYPQGAKQALLWNTTGKVIGPGKRIAFHGVIIINVSTLYKLAEYMETGMPLVERCVTIDGTAVKEPKNVLAPIGTPIRYLIEQAGGLKAEAAKVIYGGPMRGTAAKSMEESTLKATNSILVMSPESCVKPEPKACIHCGRCVAACPIGLNPTIFAKAMELEDEAARFEILIKAKGYLCITCGCCSYVCPSSRPLTEINSKASAFAYKYNAMLEAKKQEAEEE